MNHSPATAGDDSQTRPRHPQGDSDALAVFHAFRATKDPALRDQLVCDHLHLVHSVARRFSGLGESQDDLIQEGSIGLLSAVDLFDPARGVKFSTYACHLITGQIQHYLRDRGRLIRQPAWVQELGAKIMRSTEQLSQELGRDPLPSEVATRLHLPEDAIQNVLAARELTHVTSLSTPADGASDTESTHQEEEKLRTQALEDLALPIEDRIVLDEAIDSLKALEQKVVRLFYFGELTQTEIARRLGISVNYASYLLRRGITKIRAYLDNQREEEAIALTNTVVPLPPAEIPTYDALTGVYSGAYLRARLAEEIARSQRYPTNFALMLTDVHGLQEGDTEANTRLTAIGHLLRTGTRTIDLIAYLGDGRFALLLPHTGREARVLGERLCHQPASQLTLQVGFAVFPMDGTSVEGLFRAAEHTLAAANLKADPTAHGYPDAKRRSTEQV